LRGDDGDDERAAELEEHAPSEVEPPPLPPPLPVAEAVREALAPELGLSRGDAQRTLLNLLNGRLVALPSAEPARVVPAWEGEAPQEPQCKAGTKHTSLQGKHFVFRNTQEHRYSHMAMISPLPDKALWRFAVAWQSTRTGIEGTADQEFLLSFSDAPSHHDAHWTRPHAVPLSPSNTAVWGPVLHLNRDTNELWLFYAHSTSCITTAKRFAPGGDIRYVRSRDGVAWSEPTTILPQADGGGVPKVVGNQLHVHKATGRWILPVWREQLHGGAYGSTCKPAVQRTIATASGALISKDQGKTWEERGWWRASTRWLIEGTVAETPTGRLVMLFRAGKRSEKLYSIVSDDAGDTWTSPVGTDIPNPDAKANLITLKSGTLALGFNDVPSGIRRHMRLALAEDATAWRRVGEVESTKPGANFAYPTLAQDGCFVYMVYSVTRRGSKLPMAESGIKIGVFQLTQAEALGSTAALS